MINNLSYTIGSAPHPKLGTQDIANPITPPYTYKENNFDMMVIDAAGMSQAVGGGDK